MVRARAHIGLKNLAYNMRRLVYLEGAISGGKPEIREKIASEERKPGQKAALHEENSLS